MEDVWRGEAQDLLSQIAQLQEENKQLMTNLSHKDVSFSEEEFQKHEGKRRGQREVRGRLFPLSSPAWPVTGMSTEPEGWSSGFQFPKPLSCSVTLLSHHHSARREIL